MSSFCRKKTVLESFQFLFYRLKSKYVLISYNNEVTAGPTQLRTLFEKYGVVKVYEFAYKRYQSQKIYEKRKLIKEYLFLIKCLKRSTKESLGVSVEQTICQLTKIPYPQSFNFPLLKCYHSNLKTILNKFFKHHPKIQIKKYIGSRQNSVDFLLVDGSTLSVKSNSSHSKICNWSTDKKTFLRRISSS